MLKFGTMSKISRCSSDKILRAVRRDVVSSALATDCYLMGSGDEAQCQQKDELSSVLSIVHRISHGTNVVVESIQ